GRFKPPGDKSMAHRMALLASLARGRSVIDNFAPGEDCRRTLDLLDSLGVPVDRSGDRMTITGQGYFGFCPPAATLEAGNSGSTARMGCGMLAAQPFDSRLNGDESLLRRPMQRVIEPLERMGARIESTNGRLPLMVRGGNRLRGIEYSLPVASAQVKTAVLLAGLHAEGETCVREPRPSRNHTELALLRFGVPVRADGRGISVRGGSPLEPVRFRIPGDISSAAFLITAAAFLPDSELVVEQVSLNPTRTAFLKALQRMGARITLEAEGETENGEKVGTVWVKGSELTGAEVPPEVVPCLIDEIPVLAVAAAFARGETVIRGAGELRAKESDRLAVLVTGLRALGADVYAYEDGLCVRGGRPLKATHLASHGDHRMAMAWAVASLGVDGECTVDSRDSVQVSFPCFWQELSRLVSG
ncbi:MAG: 3-phosphoshikimate 1-carboxyvinyltransferase, partial [Acidobacteriota bacterium]